VHDGGTEQAEAGKPGPPLCVPLTGIRRDFPPSGNGVKAPRLVF